MGLLGKQSQTLQERVEPLSRPSAEATEEGLDHLVPTGVMLFVVAQRWGTRTPDGAVAAVFSPAGLISLHRRTGSDGRFERRKRWLHLLCKPMQECGNLPNTDLASMQRRQLRLDLPRGFAHHCAQGGNQAGNLHAPLGRASAPRRSHPTTPRASAGTGFWLFYSRFGKRGRRRPLLFQILDALVRSRQLLLEQADLLHGLLALLFSGRNAFVCCHGARLSDKGLSEQFPGKISVKGLVKHRLVLGRGQMVFLVDPSLSENEVPDGVDSR